MRLNDIVLLNYDLRPFLHFHYRYFIGSTSTFQHKLNSLYSSSVYLPLENLVPFLVPITLSVHISLDVCYEPVGLNVPVTHYGFS